MVYSISGNLGFIIQIVIGIILLIIANLMRKRPSRFINIRFLRGTPPGWNFKDLPKTHKERFGEEKAIGIIRRYGLILTFISLGIIILSFTLLIF